MKSIAWFSKSDGPPKVMESNEDDISLARVSQYVSMSAVGSRIASNKIRRCSKRC